ncbi:MAG: sensor domain-containing phosphodiesterase [Rhodospirillum sp.]|nr:sensor domain-containing phosphodiesterase [Rhodospirillum sp.]MCF8488444.1 sensor domain-containing phosphodiesterase [Rhodospirillum sp.]MCF8499106.1 sensor domain-containing phosphodiesterase [Rhodospirillum sp.]
MGGDDRLNFGRRVSDLASRSERDRYVALAFCWADLLLHLNGDGEILFAAGAFKAFTGRDGKDLVGVSFLSLVTPEDVPLASQCLRQTLKRGRVDGEILRLVRPMGLPLPMDLSGYSLDGQSYIALRMRAKITNAATDDSTRDSLTGLLGPEAFSEAAGQRIRAMVDQGRKVGVTVVNLRDYDSLRDRMDDTNAKGMLRSVGASLRAAALDQDSATLINDGSYSLLHDVDADIQGLERQLTEISRLHDPDGQGVTVETAILDMDGADQIGEVDLAKGLMYAMNHYRRLEGDKLSIRNLSSNISQLVAQGVGEVTEFKRIVAERNFSIALQPIIHAGNGDIHHYEALCRFSSKRPHESPFRYITFAEETGLIHEFDLAMATKVLEWLGTKPRNSNAYNVAINISGFSMGMDSYVAGLKALLDANPWSKGKVMFEITESSRMSDLDAANRFIGVLRNRGYQVCLDDFGAGAASFQYLSALEVDTVKIDGSAVRNAMRGVKGKAFLSALTDLCRRLGVRTIAEMIDSPQSLEFVRDCGCDYVQGFLFGRPSLDIKDFQPLPHAKLFQPEIRVPRVSSGRTVKGRLAPKRGRE